MGARSQFNLAFESLDERCDSEAVQALSQMAILTFTDTFRHYNQADIEHYIENSLSVKALSDELADRNNRFYFLRLNDVRVGFLKWIWPTQVYLEHATVEADNPFLLQRFYFLPDYCGRGLANIALEFVTTFAKYEARADFLYLSVWEKNYRAQRFYQKHGFRTLGSFDYPVGEEIDREFLYGKHL